MPEISNEDFFKILEETEFTPLSLIISREDDLKAEKQCKDYLEKGILNMDKIIPLTIYNILSKLDEDKQINFIRENISYIRENSEKIFLYTMISPKALSYYFNYRVIKELRNIDLDIFKKIISCNYENLFYGFNEDEFVEFYTEFYEDLKDIENIEFINSLYYHNRHLYDEIKLDDINDVFTLQDEYNKEFIVFLLEKYNDKIDSFTGKELLCFLSYVDDFELYKNLINKYYDKLNTYFENIDEYELNDYLSEISEEEQEVLISNFFDNIIKKQDIKKLIYRIKPNIIIELYNKNKELFDQVSLNEWLGYCCDNRVFNDSFKMILDTFNITDIESIFKTSFYFSFYYKRDIRALKFIENKYRNNIKTTGIINPISDETSIFSEIYLKNLSELKSLLQNGLITKNDDLYKKHLTNFILFLKNRNIVFDIEDDNFREVERLFYKIVMGTPISIIYNLLSIEEITLFNRLGKMDFKVEDFTVGQLEKYNVKHHKQLYSKYLDSDWHLNDYKKLLLKLLFMIGFTNSKALLEIDDSIPVLEHLVGNVDVKSIKLDEFGNPILNSKIMNLLFSDKDYSKIREMLSNKNNDLYKFFPRIFSEWEMISINEKDKNLGMIIDFLKSDEITLPPKYYRLEGLFKYIGCKNSIVNETLLLHDNILKREVSSIPRVCGEKDGYSYELLELDNMEGLAIGNKTDCCFTILGNGYSCLKHAMTSSNGRIFVIKKDGEILAHSWVWRNGDLLCFDNIEISKTISEVDFFDIYLSAIDKIIKTSFEKEEINTCIKNVTIGFTNFDKNINGIEKYPCLISKTCNLEEKSFGSRLGRNRKLVDSLPQPIEEVGYSDSKNVQYLIRGNGKFNLGYSPLIYSDSKKEILYYNSEMDNSDDNILLMNKKINALRYIIFEKNNDLDNFSMIDVSDYDEAYCDDDWFILKLGEVIITECLYSDDEYNKYYEMISGTTYEGCGTKVLKNSSLV